MTASWRRAFHRRIAVARAGNVIGGGDYGEDRLVPDCIRALCAGSPIAVRNPSATRPWQHVLDCLSGYLWLGARLAKEADLADAFNFGPRLEAQRPVRELVETLLQHWPGEWTDASDPNAPHEAPTLSLNIDKARPYWVGCRFGVLPKPCNKPPSGISNGMKTNAAGADLCRAQLEAYAAAASAQSCVWAR